MARLRMTHRPDNSFPRAVFEEGNLIPVGRVSAIFMGRTLKFQCRRHPQCELLLDKALFEDGDESSTQRLRIGYKFLGLGAYASRSEHYKESSNVTQLLREARLERLRAEARRRGGEAASSNHQIVRRPLAPPPHPFPRL